MGEGRGEGENNAILSSYVPLPFIPSHQGRGNPTFYESIKIDIRTLFICLSNDATWVKMKKIRNMAGFKWKPK